MSDVDTYHDLKYLLPDDEQPEYANSEAVELGNVSKLLETNSLDNLLQYDRDEEVKRDERVQWFHGKVNRENAETILKEGMLKLQNDQRNTDGLFLIRDSSKSFTLSLVAKNKVYHYLIDEKKPGYFQIDDGDSIQGLDKFVEHHNIAGHGLPIKLNSFCKGTPPPILCRRTGYTNLLHRAILEGNPMIVRTVLSHNQCPHINAKNVWGRTALHDAAEHGYHDIVKLLLEYKADVKIKDTNGHTALQRAALKDHPNIIAILYCLGKADPLEKSPLNGWVALHEAAMAGNLNSVKMLLDISHCPHPRNFDKETPYDVAVKYGRNDCINYFENYKVPEATKKAKVWFHSELNREGATKIFEMFGLREGLFLIRKSTKGEGLNVLSVCHSQEANNYVIKNKTYIKECVYYIDDGPYLCSLEHLIYHYNRWADGLPCTLRTAVSTSNQLDEVPREDDYYNLSIEFENTEKPEIYKPSLPPRVEPNSPTAAGNNVYAKPIKTVEHKSPKPKEHPKPTSPTTTEGPRVPFSEPPSRPHECQPKIIKEKNIKLGSQLGEGEYGSVLKGILTVPDKGLLTRSKKIEVAIKTFHDGSVGNEADFLREADVMQSLDHRCITKLLGVCHGKQLMLVEEYVPMGSMLDYLLDNFESIDVKTDLYLWAGQIAQGMEYLESKRLVHRDLAARNILLASKQQVKISDFGLSRATGGDNDYYRATKGGRWPIKWYAPESVNYGKFTHASDVWSYGVTLWEMFSFGESPYGDKKGVEVIQDIEKGRRLNCPDKCPKTVFTLMQNCWKKDPSKRITFHLLVENFFNDPEHVTVKKFRE